MFIAINTFKISFSFCIFLKWLEFKSYLESVFKRIMRTDHGCKLTTVSHFVAEGSQNRQSIVLLLDTELLAPQSTEKVLEGRGGS